MTGVSIIGVGLHPFGRHDPELSGMSMGAQAVRLALADAGVSWSDIGYAVGGSNVSGKPDTLVGQLGLTGVPFVNVRNGCATGGVALATAAGAIRAGDVDLALVVGFDKHQRGAFAARPADYGHRDWYGETGLMVTTQFFAMKDRRYLHTYGLDERILGQVAAKAFRCGELNPDAWRRKSLTVDEIMSARPINPPLTQYMLCSPSEGATALVLASTERAADLCEQPIRLAAVSMRTRRFGSFEVFAPWLPAEQGPSPSVDAAQAAFALAGVDPGDVQVAQVQDTDSGAEVYHMAETGLCEHGEQKSLLDDSETAPTGRLPINTDGGCLANGEPIGASGLRQIREIVLQLRGTAGQRQVAGRPEVGFTHVYGAPGISACTVLTT